MWHITDYPKNKETSLFTIIKRSQLCILWNTIIERSHCVSHQVPSLGGLNSVSCQVCIIRRNNSMWYILNMKSKISGKFFVKNVFYCNQFLKLNIQSTPPKTKSRGPNFSNVFSGKFSSAGSLDKTPPPPPPPPQKKKSYVICLSEDYIQFERLYNFLFQYVF